MPNQAKTIDDSEPGKFGEFGGTYISETLIHAVHQLAESYAQVKEDEGFIREFRGLLTSYVGRPSPIYHAERLSRSWGGADIYLKREDLNHTGAHKINNAVGQVLLAKRMGKSRIIAETGAGQHGVATATVCAREGLECVVYMGEEDIARQSPNVQRMNLLGAKVEPVSSGSKTLKDALNEAMRDWVTQIDNTFYVIGSVAGPHPYPTMVRDFNAVVGKECLKQMPEITGRQPDCIVACVGGGSNAMGIFHPYIPMEEVALIGVEAGGAGVETGRHAATLTAGRPGILHGMYSYLLQDDEGQVAETASVSAGLDYPGVGPEHAWLKDTGRATYVAATDDETLSAFRDLCLLEGIIPALETAHALAHAKKIAPDMSGQEHPHQLVGSRRQGSGHRSELHRGEGDVLTRIDSAFASATAPLLIPFLTAGYPRLGDAPGLMAAAAESGAGIIELGVPFSDPVADGPTIQRSSAKAIDNGMTLGIALEQVREFRAAAQTPVVLMGYANTFLQFGIPRFSEEAADAGVDGVIIVDLPAESSGSWRGALDSHGLQIVMLAATTTSPARLRAIAEHAAGYIYCVSLKGVTGSGAPDTDAVGGLVSALRESSGVPVAVGFGVRKPEQAAAVAKIADGVVFGSALIDAIDAAPGKGSAVVSEFVGNMREAVVA